MPSILREERRAQERFCLACHVDVEGFPGFTSEIGADSMLFETQAAFSPGAHVSLRLKPLGRGVAQGVARRAVVVRVDERGGTYDVAVKLFTPLFVQDMPEGLMAGVAETVPSADAADDVTDDDDFGAYDTRYSEFDDSALVAF